MPDMPKIISDNGAPMMILQQLRRKGDKLEITGQIMGAWPSKMYITPDEFGGFIRLALSWSVISYLLLYPFYYIAGRLKKQRKQDT
jgi:hypothetical protein